MVHTTIICVAAVVVSLAVHAASDGSPAAESAPRSVKKLMAAGFTRPGTPGRKAMQGQASREELGKLLEISTELSKNRPPKGSQEQWDKRTEALIVALRDGIDEKEGAVERIKIAVRCVDCHRVHRPTKEP